mgnify:CR=1 FL=1
MPRVRVREQQQLALGFFGIAYYEQNSTKVKAVPIDDGKADNGAGPIAPSVETVKTGTYQPLSRPLFIYVNAANGTLILKFFLNVSKNEQKSRFLARLSEPEKHWKFSAGDIKERGFWDKYMQAYEDAITATSKHWAPWYVIPADSKPFMQLQVAKLIVANMETLNLRYPTINDGEKVRFAEYQRLLMEE